MTRIQPKNRVLAWVEDRLPVLSFLSSHTSGYYAPKNFNLWYYFGSLALLFLMPWLDQGKVKSIRYRGLGYKIALGLFALSFVLLAAVGAGVTAELIPQWFGEAADATFIENLFGRIWTLVYFGFFVFLWVYTRFGFEKTKPVPDRVTSHADCDRRDRGCGGRRRPAFRRRVLSSGDGRLAGAVASASENPEKPPSGGFLFGGSDASSPPRWRAASFAFDELDTHRQVERTDVLGQRAD